MKKLLLLAICGILGFGYMSVSCKKKKKSKEVTFSYDYPEIQFSVGDSADYGNSIDGWNFVRIEKIENQPFINQQKANSVYSTDITSILLQKCEIQITGGDSTFDLFDSIQVKLGGTFTYGTEIHVSPYGEQLVAQTAPVPKTGSLLLALGLTGIQVKDPLKMDEVVAFRIKLFSSRANMYYLPSTLTMKARISVTVTGMDH